MNYLIKVIVGLSLVLTIGCARQMNITPPLNTLASDGISKIDKNVGYYISSDDLSKEVTTPGGGGDKLRYFSYRDCAPVMKKILSNIFNQVHRFGSPDDKQFISANNISYVFIPKIETDSSSESALTWPPTRFSVSLRCKATDSSGSVIWEKEVKGEGEATYDEFKHDLPLAAKRAVRNAFSLLQTEIIQSQVFR
jgi:hypothetical protein